jgi:hypothetical protein
MAAEAIPELALWTVQVVNPGVVNVNPTMKIAATDTVAFRNGCTFAINISFSSMFPAILNLQPGQTSSPIGGGTLNTTVDYWIYNGSMPQKATGGPYAIEFGTGPLIVSISGLDTSPGAIAIPSGGQIQFNCDVQYSINWTFQNGQSANVWSPQQNPLPAGKSDVMTALPGANSQSLKYTITASLDTRGGGTVNVGS